MGGGGRTLRSVVVYVVRHGCAGDKREWPGPDDDRPLDEAGIAQAGALADTLAGVPIGRIVSSPARRCRDSVVPLAHRLGREVELHDGLRADAAPTSIVALLAAVGVAPDGDPGGPGDPGDPATVLCTHGEVMRPLLAALRKSPSPLVSSDDGDESLLAKGTGWRLTFDAGGQVASLTHVVPDDPFHCTAHPG